MTKTFICDCCGREHPEANKLTVGQRDYCLLCGWVVTLDKFNKICWRVGKPGEMGIGYIKCTNGVRQASWTSNDKFWYQLDNETFSIDADSPDLIGWIYEEDIPQL